jgi:hypothetical protein
MRRVAAWALLLLATPAMAQETESVTVNASALLGAWKITRPSYVSKEGLFGDLKFGPPNDLFCRIARSGDELIMRCLPGRDNEAKVSFTGGTLHLAWGTMMARLAVDGVMQPGMHFAGHVSVRVAGIGLADPAVSTGSKLDLADARTDRGGLAQALRDTVKEKVLTAELGSVQAVVYLGQQDKSAPPGQPAGKEYFTVYAVEFESGERICGLHRGDDGRLDAFQCT